MIASGINYLTSTEGSARAKLATIIENFENSSSAFPKFSLASCFTDAFSLFTSILDFP